MSRKYIDRRDMRLRRRAANNVRRGLKGKKLSSNAIDIFIQLWYVAIFIVAAGLIAFLSAEVIFALIRL